MKIRKECFALLRLCLVVTCFFPVSVLAEEVQKISIVSTEDGWGHRESKVEIVAKDGSYYRGDEKIQTSLVQNLMKILKEPALTLVNIDNLKIDQPWIIRNKASFLQKKTGGELALMQEAMNNPAAIEHAVLDYYQSYWTDDMASVSVEIKTSKRVISLKSNDQHAFMIPWKVILSKDETQNTWNANVGRAVGDLLPDGAINQNRLTGLRLPSELNRSLEFGMRDIVQAAKAKEQFQPEVKVLNQKYKLSEFHVTSMSGLGFDVNGLHVILSGGDLAPGIEADAHLPKQNGRLTGVEDLLKNTSKYGALVASVPWFNEWLKANPGAKAEMTMVEGVSITSKAKGSLKEDFSSKRTKLLKEISSSWDQSVLLTVMQSQHQYSRWIVLPDKRMVLWHATGRPVLKWADELPKSWERYGQDAYGVVVSPEGKLEALK